MFPPSSRLALRALRPLSRSASKSSNPWPSVQGAPDEQPKARAWLGTASRISNFVIVPTVLLYAVFYADFGEHEHVFQPPRRWLEAQKASFFSLSPEEQKLAGVSPAKPAASDEDTGADRSWCVSSATCLLSLLSTIAEHAFAALLSQHQLSAISTHSAERQTRRQPA